MTRTAAPHDRQRYRDNSGRAAECHPCYVCGKSAGYDYLSHPATEHTLADELLCLCQSCYNKCAELSGPEAVAWANTTQKKVV